MINPVPMTLEFLQHLAGRQLPKPDNAVPRSREESLARLAEVHRTDVGPMTCQDTKTLTGSHVPETNISIESARSHRSLILSPGESRDRFFVPVEHLKAITGLDIPNMNLGIGPIASSQQTRSIGAEDPIHLLRFNLQMKYSVLAATHHLDFPTSKSVGCLWMI